MPPTASPRLLLCPPDHFGIEYEINAWMHRERGADRVAARAQWQNLCAALLECGAQIELVAPQPGLPDMVFTANAGLVIGGRVILSSFRHPQRRGEAAHFAHWFEQNGWEIIRLPEDLFFEGEGDALWCGDVLFCGYRFRSDIRAHERVAELLHQLVVSVELVDDRFYHLDTCFCPLPDGNAVWFPEAFDEYAQRAIRAHVRELVPVTREEALRFACNALVLGREVILPAGCPALEKVLRARGYRTHAVEVGEFLKSGGACKCLALRLERESQPW
jgi:N-dimethylarginine dimethylaminohydrolase